MKNRKKSLIPFLCLGFILLFAFSLRAWGINYDLPYIYHPDEPGYISIALNIVKTGDLNPHFFNYPSLFFYINGFAYFMVEVIGRITGVITSFDSIRGPISINLGVTKAQTPAIVLLSRYITVLFSLGAIVIVFQIGKKIANHWSVGVMAALIMAISPINIANARYITPDTFTQFFAILTLLGALYVFEQGLTWQYILTGIFVGFTASCKYNGALIVTPLLMAHFFRCGKKAIWDKKIYIALVFALLGFLISTPYAIFDFSTFLKDFQYEVVHYSTGHIGMEGNTPSFYLQLMWQSNGLVYIFAVVEFIRGIFTKNRFILLVSIFPLIYLPFISSFIVRNDRTFLPVTPFIFLLASSLLYSIFQHIYRSQLSKKRSLSLVLFGLLIALTLAIPSYKTISNSAKDFNFEDARETSRKWIIDNLPKGSKIAFEPYSPFLEMAGLDIHAFSHIIDASPDWYIKNNYHYLIFSSGMYGRFFLEPDLYSSQIDQYNQFFTQFKQIKDFQSGAIEIKVYQIP